MNNFKFYLDIRDFYLQPAGRGVDRAGENKHNIPSLSRGQEIIELLIQIQSFEMAQRRQAMICPT